MLNDTINWFKANKDVFSALQSIVTILAFIIGGFWALRKIFFERPYAGALEITINGSLNSSNPNANLLHLSIRVKNIGKASIKIGNSSDNYYKSSIDVHAYPRSEDFLHTDNNKAPIKIISHSSHPEQSDYIINAQFVELFKPWFEDREFAIIESGECETYSHIIAIDKSIAVILFKTTIYETRKNRTLGRPYYWRETALINCTQLT